PIPEGERIEIGSDAGPVALGRLDRAMPFGSEAKLLQDLAIELQHDLFGPIDEAHRRRPFQVVLVGVAIEALRLGEFVVPEAAVSDVAIELLRVGLSRAVPVALRTPPAREQADAGFALVVDDVVGVEAGVFRTAVELDQPGQLEPCAE